MNCSYSPSMNLFYGTDWINDYCDSWPMDCINITEAQFKEFTGEPPEGKIRVAGADGLPCWADAPPPTHNELSAAAELGKQRRIDEASVYMNSKQWPGKAVMGRLKDKEKAQYNEWLDYLDELEAVDTSTAPDINWPEKPEA